MIKWDKTQLPYSHGPSQESLQPNSQSHIHRESEMPQGPMRFPSRTTFPKPVAVLRKVLLPQRNRLHCPACPPSAASTAEGKSHSD